jgi:GNAT superfamily N-acetyltransferase
MHDDDSTSVEAPTESDVAEISKLYLASRAEAFSFLRQVHTDSEVLDWIRDVLLKRCETAVARRRGTILGFAALHGAVLDQLYVLPGHYRRGIGRMLLDWAKARSPNRLWLYTFQRNARARAFYESQGFRALTLSDGARNEEKEPDILYEWIPAG